MESCVGRSEINHHHHHHHLPPWIRSFDLVLTSTCCHHFLGVSTISSSSGFVIEGVFQESVVIHSLKVVDPILFVFGSYVLYSRDL